MRYVKCGWWNTSNLDWAAKLLKRLTPKWTKYIDPPRYGKSNPGVPNPKQQLFLCLDEVEEIFFGGAAGPGKSWAILAGALQWADAPGYAALVMRKNYPDLAQPGGLMDVSHQWLDETDAKWNEERKQWRFPSGAILQFGHMDSEAEIKRYKGGEYQYVGIDELTDFKEREAIFLHSRLRRKMGVSIPVRFRAGSNPGGVGHDWVKKRYVDYKGSEDRLFLPATMDDNPILDRALYLKFLERLDPVTRLRLIKGDWTVTDGGTFINRSWWNDCFVGECPIEPAGRVRAWDLAVSTATDAKETAGVRMSRTNKGLWIIEDVVHGKWHSGDRDGVILQKAHEDTEDVSIKIEEEGGSGGIAQNEALIRMLAGFRVESVKVTGDKFVRAGALASQVQAGNVRIRRGSWNTDFIDQLHHADPTVEIKDQMLDMLDAASLGFNCLVTCTLNPFAVETPEPLKDRRDRFTEAQKDELFDQEQEQLRLKKDRNIWETMFRGEPGLTFWEN